jgi:class 3 adenylate cyclase
MEAKYLDYKYEDRLKNIDKVLSEKIQFKENAKFPLPHELKHNSQFYIDVIILTVDIRGSTKLSEFLSGGDLDSKGKIILVKLYKLFISEVIAVMKGCDNIFRVYIEGDGVWAAFKDENEDDVKNVFRASTRISSLIDILNVKLIEKKYTDIKIGMGINKGKSLYVLGGYKYTNINEDVWLGTVVNRAFKLGKIANKRNISELAISEEVYNNLHPMQKSKLIYSYEYTCFHGKVANKEMQDWLLKNSPTYIRCEVDYCHYQMKNKSLKKNVLFAVIMALIFYIWQEGILYLG